MMLLYKKVLDKNKKENLIPHPATLKPYGSELVEAEGEAPRAKLGRLLEFNKQIQAADPKHVWGILREWSEKLFDEFPKPEIHHQMLCLRIQYELVRLDYVEQKIKIPPRIQQNIIASKHYDIDKLAPSLRGIMESLTKGENMATTRKTASGPKATAPRPPAVTKQTVTQSYIHFFQTNGTAKLTDVALAAAMCKAHPDKKKYTPGDIAAVRGMYNRGKLSGQKGKPAVRCVEVVQPSAKAIATAAKKSVTKK